MKKLDLEFIKTQLKNRVRTGVKAGVTVKYGIRPEPIMRYGIIPPSAP